MTVPPEYLDQTVKAWVSKAADDLRIARHSLKMESPPLWAVAYHLQQAVEKALKAVLVRNLAHFPKTHDIRLLLDLCLPYLPVSSDWSEAAGRLTEYGILARYPSAVELVDSDITDAISTAERVLDCVTSYLDTFGTNDG